MRQVSHATPPTSRHARRTPAHRPPRTGGSLIRRIVTPLATSLAVLVLFAAPALAGSSFTPAEAPADSDHGLTLTITEPEDEAYGDTARVTVVAPAPFAVLACQQELAWDCTAEPDSRKVTFSRTVLGALGDTTLQFSVHTPAINGTYTFTVTQADGAAEPVTVRSTPQLTVTGGQDPAPPPPPDDGDGSGDAQEDTSGGGSDSTGGTDDSDSGGSAGGGTSSSGGSSDGSGDSGSADASDDDADSGGGTRPRRTEGRATGTPLEIVPRQPSSGDDPTLTAPAVADEPAVAPPTDGADAQDEDDETPTMTAVAGQAGEEEAGDPGGPPWQQLLGGALLVAGGAFVAARRWDVGLRNAPGRLRDVATSIVDRVRNIRSG